MFEFVPGMKPRMNVWLEDTRVWFVLRICDEVKVSVEIEIVMRKENEVMNKNKKKKPLMFVYGFFLCLVFLFM
jgi:hypothetical protein